MIASVNIAVVFNSRRVPIDWLMMANRARFADKIGERPSDIHCENLADVALNPVAENCHQKLTELLRAH